MSSSPADKLSQAQDSLQRGDALGARSLCQEVLAQEPRNAAALTLVGITYLMTGHAREAVPPLQQAVAAQPLHGAALENLGLAYLMLGEFSAAERSLRSATQIPRAGLGLHAAGGGDIESGSAP